jgi:hypothetical protein
MFEAGCGDVAHAWPEGPCSLELLGILVAGTRRITAPQWRVTIR